MDNIDKLKELLENFYNWEKESNYYKQRFEYKNPLSKEVIFQASDEELIDAVRQFTLEGGGIAGKGHRFCGMLIESITPQIAEFRTHLQEIWSDNFNLVEWMNTKFPNWKSMKTILMHRINPDKYPPQNYKTDEGLKVLGYYPAFEWGSSEGERYLKYIESFEKIVEVDSANLNFAKVDLLIQFIIGEEEGKNLCSKLFNTTGDKYSLLSNIYNSFIDFYSSKEPYIKDLMELNKYPFVKINYNNNKNVHFEWVFRKSNLEIGLHFMPEAEEDLEKIKQIYNKEIHNLNLDYSSQKREKGFIIYIENYDNSNINEAVDIMKQIYSLFKPKLDKYYLGESKLTKILDIFFDCVKKKSTPAEVKNLEYNYEHTTAKISSNINEKDFPKYYMGFYPQENPYNDSTAAFVSVIYYLNSDKLEICYGKSWGISTVEYKSNPDELYPFNNLTKTLPEICRKKWNLNKFDEQTQSHISDFHQGGYVYSSYSKENYYNNKQDIINDVIKVFNDYKKYINPRTFNKSINSKVTESTSSKKEEQIMSNSDIIPLNQILYGPPGTGKTYKTAEEALRIIMDESEFNSLDLKNREDVMKQFKYYKDQNQIKFITFHQNYSYEDFIEGIRPVLDCDQVKYEKRPGILKQITDLAVSETIKSLNNQAFIKTEEKRVFRLYLNEFYNECIENNILKHEKLYASDDVYNQLKPDDLILVYSTYYIKAIGLIKEFNEQHQTVEWLIKDEIIPREKIVKKAFFGRRICQIAKESINFEVLNNLLNPSENKTVKNYVIIIDEINRGNISKIFGELITLLEPDKRLGCENELTVPLPYAEEGEKEFGLPQNLYLLGTMNTADRSIALMDIALRRRFTFTELMPKPDLVVQTIPFNNQNLNFRLVFENINKKITVSLDRDHQIGHSYFMPEKVYDITSLKNAWFNSLIPLLNEYFYCDWDKLKRIIKPFVKPLLNEVTDSKLKTTLEYYGTTEEELYEFKSIDEFANDEVFFEAMKELESQ